MTDNIMDDQFDETRWFDRATSPRVESKDPPSRTPEITRMTPESIQKWLKVFRSKAQFNNEAHGYNQPVLGEYLDGYCRYFGMGHHLYVFVGDRNAGRFHEEKMKDIMSQKVNPAQMVEPMKEASQWFAIVMLSDMGGMSVWEVK